MSHPATTASSGIPVLGVLSMPARIAVVVTVALAIVTILTDLVLHLFPETVVFLLAAAAILGLAWVVGLGTERLGALTGPQVGGILNATFGNIAELIIAFFALQRGLIEVVQGEPSPARSSATSCSSSGRACSRRPEERAAEVQPADRRLERRAPRPGAGRAVRACRVRVQQRGGEGRLVEESVLIALLLIVGYVLSLIFQFTNPATTLGGHEPSEGHGGPPWTARTAVFVLLAAAGLLAFTSEILVGSIEPFIEEFGLSQFFVGVVLIPTIGNLAEHLVAVQLAYKNKMEFAMAVAYGSSLQVALFVAPVLVLLGLVVGQDMALVFTPLEVAAVAAAVGISALIALDGESNWLEGALLMLVYVILAVSFFEFV